MLGDGSLLYVFSSLFLEWSSLMDGQQLSEDPSANMTQLLGVGMGGSHRGM